MYIVYFFGIWHENQSRVVRTTNNIIRSIQYSTWVSFFIRENMSESLTLSIAENKLNELNKNIVEIKKKIQLSGNNSNRTKHFSLIYIALDNPSMSQHCKTATKLQSRTLPLYRIFTSTVLFSYGKCVLANLKLTFFTIFSNFKIKIKEIYSF